MQKHPKNGADLTGQRFFRLTVLKYAGSKNGHLWECKCDCGKIKKVYGYDLKSETVRSCGCWKNEQAAERAIQRNTRHSETHTRLYRIWHSMKQRCYYKKGVPYANYGGRGIRVCDEWLQNFVAFRDWALSHGYADNLSLDRIDPNGNYEPNNCRWATAYEQTHNRRPPSEWKKRR